jgi:alpha-L-fucosidase
MPWWREARFGMFIHWGVYAVPAGIYNGKPISGIGEWILRNGTIPVSEYRAYAKKFNPVRYNPGAWTDLARDAGMKYIVITSKHHDGFALFDSKVSDWDIADATPYKTDLLMPLAEAARKRGLKFGLYYSQAQDWVHPGGAKWKMEDGGGWDELQKGRFDSYLKTIALPQVEEILTRYKPDVVWWDTPHLMTTALAAPFASLVAANPMLITNNRLGGDNPGDTETPEQFIPATGFAGRDWEVCMTMNDTWGYKSDDHNWKSTTDLIHKLSDIASKGGNFLLNIGPTAEGDIPAPIIERLKQMGKWMKVNGDAIYGTTASPFNKLSWGRATTKVRDGLTTLYLHVWNWPSDGKLLVSGLRTPIKGATLLAGKKRLTTRASDGSVIIDLPAKAPDSIESVIKLDLAGALDVVEILPRQIGNGSLVLTAIDVDLHNQLGTDVRLESDRDGNFIGNWTDARAWASWQFSVEKTGKYDVIAELAADAPASIRMTVGTQKSDVVTAPTCGLQKFERLKFGQLTITTAGKQELSLKPQAKDWKLMNLRSLTLTPVAQ